MATEGNVNGLIVPAEVFAAGGNDACEKVRNWVAQQLGGLPVVEMIARRSGETVMGFIEDSDPRDQRVYYADTGYSNKASSMFWRPSANPPQWNGGFRTDLGKAVTATGGGRASGTPRAPRQPRDPNAPATITPRRSVSQDKVTLGFIPSDDGTARLVLGLMDAQGHKAEVRFIPDDTEPGEGEIVISLAVLRSHFERKLEMFSVDPHEAIKAAVELNEKGDIVQAGWQFLSYTSTKVDVAEARQDIFMQMAAAGAKNQNMNEIIAFGQGLASGTLELTRTGMQKKWDWLDQFCPEKPKPITPVTLPAQPSETPSTVKIDLADSPSQVWQQPEGIDLTQVAKIAETHEPGSTIPVTVEPPQAPAEEKKEEEKAVDPAPASKAKKPDPRKVRAQLQAQGKV